MPYALGMNTLYIDLLGYLASFIILVSLTMRSIVKLRVINALGSALFVCFAVLTGSMPVLVMNLGIILIDLWYVYGLRRKKTAYTLVPLEKDSAFLEYFYQKHRTEIEAIFGPDVRSLAEGYSCYLADTEAAGLFAWQSQPDGRCRILIDFVTPRYRDTRIGSYFFGEQLKSFAARGFRVLVYRRVGETHWKYIEKIGFRPETGPEAGPGNYRKDIPGDRV